MATTAKKDQDWGRFDILKVAKYITMASITVTVLAFFVIMTKGFDYGVDFAGGIETQVQFKEPVDAAAVRKFMSGIGYGNANVQAIGSEHEFLIRVEMVRGKSDAETNQYIEQTVGKIKTGLTQTFATQGPEIRKVDTVGPQVGAELRKNGILAGFYCLLLILIYVGLRFDYSFATGAVFCLFHDALITLGIYSLLGWEVTSQTMAAILTIIGYSLNDTIVIFDRIRENQAIYRDKSLYWISNRSINETLSRTILTYVTTYMTVLAMVFLADGVIQDFAVTMAIGMFLGVYSTVYVATPLMLVIEKFQRERRERRLQTAKA